MTTDSGRDDGAAPDQDELLKRLEEFRDWVNDRTTTVSIARLMEAAAMSRAAASGYVGARGKTWGADPRSLYWRWLERRDTLMDMDAEGLRRLSDEFRAVKSKLDTSVLAVGQSWWEYGGYCGLGVEVGVVDGKVEVVVLPQAEAELDGSEAELDGDGGVAGAGAAGDTGAAADDRGTDERQPIESVDRDAFPDTAAGLDETEAGSPNDTEAGALDDAEAQLDGEDEPDLDDDAGDGDAGVGRVNGVADMLLGDALPAGKPAKAALALMGTGARALVDERIRQASTVEEVALIAGAPVLAKVPGFSLANAKVAALLRTSGWHPADPVKDKDGRIPEYRPRSTAGLWGDGPIMLYYGMDADFLDDGARLVAFAPLTVWTPDQEMPYSAVRMRTGVTMEQRQSKHAYPDHDGRPDRVGYRPANWAPRRQYPDHDWFFGSEGTFDRAYTQSLVDSGDLREGDTELMEALAEWDMRLVPVELRKPSAAEVMSKWYRVRAIDDAFSGVEGYEGSPFALELEREKLCAERVMLSDEYAITPYYRGEGKKLPGITRISERRWMGERIEAIPQEIRRARKRQRRRRFWNALFFGPFRALRRGHYKRKYRRLRKKEIFPGQEGDPDIDSDGYWYAGGGLGFDKDGAFDWNDYEARDELSWEHRFGSFDPDDFCGLDYTEWGAQLVSWDKRDWRRWYSGIEEDGDDMGADDIGADDQEPDFDDEVDAESYDDIEDGHGDDAEADGDDMGGDDIGADDSDRGFVQNLKSAWRSGSA